LCVLRRLDGRHDRQALLAGLREAAASGELRLPNGAAPVVPDADVLGQDLNNVLKTIADSALLVE
jgi:methyltransferase-like protein